MISDVHGNIKALEKCLDFLRQHKTDRIIFLGDSIGYLPYGIEVLKMLKNEGIECIRGNHEAMYLGILPVSGANKDIYKLYLVDSNAASETKEYLYSWNDSITLEADGKRYYFVHGSPSDLLTGYVYPDTDLRKLSSVNYDIIVMGHTHYPFVREEFNKIFVNAGSVGLPRDKGNLSSFVIIETDPLIIKHYRIAFDVEEILSGTNETQVHPATAERMRRNSTDAVLGEIVTN